MHRRSAAAVAVAVDVPAGVLPRFVAASERDEEPDAQDERTFAERRLGGAASVERPESALRIVERARAENRCGVGGFGAVGRLEKRLLKWQPRSGETEKL